ncbi:ribosome maturation factor RimP [Heliobacterium gestii]|uniref:Ribosome maturation factor RimP n=1 Tax=Heliomicrobium gestii TaxID=2699 RepID=A0A845LJ31_HELGE|nr:ribosome maturation factor RimP [Heliomicrobium gestii]MBM7868377.1 ribosome maturation factor RimP [Heliomicrobium gestii]MZP44569.1 ribosome maturation factor RimP [Heliomicrobium gestii]
MSGKVRLEDRVTAWATPITEELGLELADVEWVKEGGSWYLRIFIDKEAGIEMDDCQEVSRRIDEILDREDPVAHGYSLEVSSPGIDRPLKSDRDYERFRGQTIRITTFAPVNNAKEHIGELVGKNEASIIITKNDEEQAIPLPQVSSVRLYPGF